MNRKKYIQTNNDINTVVELSDVEIAQFEKDKNDNYIIDTRFFKPYVETPGETPDKVKEQMEKLGSVQAVKLMEENDIDPTEIKGTGTNGAITVQDVRDYISKNPD